MFHIFMFMDFILEPYTLILTHDLSMIPWIYKRVMLNSVGLMIM